MKGKNLPKLVKVCGFFVGKKLKMAANAEQSFNIGSYGENNLRLLFLLLNH
jgi:hypothetical protein